MVDIGQDQAVRARQRLWNVFFVAAVILALMVHFPLRIALDEIVLDVIFYSGVALACLLCAVLIYRRYRGSARRLIWLIVFCALLAGWQVVDLVGVRDARRPSVLAFGYGNRADFEGFGWYGLRLRDPAILCHSLFEEYVGTYALAITIRIKRDATWFACGG